MFWRPSGKWLWHSFHSSFNQHPTPHAGKQGGLSDTQRPNARTEWGLNRHYENYENYENYDQPVANATESWALATRIFRLLLASWTGIIRGIFFVLNWKTLCFVLSKELTPCLFEVCLFEDPKTWKQRPPIFFRAPRLRPAGRQFDWKLSVGDKNFEATFSVLNWHN